VISKKREKHQKRKTKNKKQKNKKRVFLHVSFPSPYFPSLGQVWPLFYAPIERRSRECAAPRATPSCKWEVTIFFVEFFVEIVILYPSNLYIRVYQSLSILFAAFFKFYRWLNAFQEALLIVVRNMRSGVTKIQAWKRCLTQLTRRKSCVVQGNGVLLDTKNGKGRSVLSAGKQFGFKKNAQHSR